MFKQKSTILLMLLFFLLPGCREESTPTGVNFSHELHLGRGYECGLCHRFYSDLEPQRPDKRVCRFCHETGDSDQPEPDCAECHTNREFKIAGVERPTFADNKFTHELHLTAKVACTDCHLNQEQADNYQAIVIPQMPECLACHKKVGASQECASCHHDLRDDLKPASHQQNWLELHGQSAIYNYGDNCNYCHAEKDYCLDCHLAERPRNHTLFFRNRGHGDLVENNRSSCQPCHQQDFCLSCHDPEDGVKPASHVAGFGDRRPYTHCSSCHFPDGAANGCRSCHSAGGIQSAHFEAMEEGNIREVPQQVLDSGQRNCMFVHPFARVSPRHPIGTVNNHDCLACHVR